jgi:hypothetical protein
MLKEAKKWVQTLETTLTELAKEFNKPIEELDAQFEEWYDNGGSDFDLGGPYTSPEAFAKEYRADRQDQAESEAYEEVYAKMRAFAAHRGYDLQDWEIDRIIDGAEEDGDNVLDCADRALRELTEDWVADHQE